MRDFGPVWATIAAREGLIEADLERLASPWHTDLDLGREIECVTDMSKSRKAGFLAYQDTRDSFFDLFRPPPNGAGHSLGCPTRISWPLSKPKPRRVRMGVTAPNGIFSTFRLFVGDLTSAGSAQRCFR